MSLLFTIAEIVSITIKRVKIPKYQFLLLFGENVQRFYKMMSKSEGTVKTKGLLLKKLIII